jgi:hypothetical protein
MTRRCSLVLWADTCTRVIGGGWIQSQREGQEEHTKRERPTGAGYTVVLILSYLPLQYIAWRLLWNPESGVCTIRMCCFSLICGPMRRRRMLLAVSPLLAKEENLLFFSSHHGELSLGVGFL